MAPQWLIDKAQARECIKALYARLQQFKLAILALDAQYQRGEVDANSYDCDRYRLTDDMARLYNALFDAYGLECRVIAWDNVMLQRHGIRPSTLGARVNDRAVHPDLGEEQIVTLMGPYIATVYDPDMIEAARQQRATATGPILHFKTVKFQTKPYEIDPLLMVPDVPVQFGFGNAACSGPGINPAKG